MRQGRKSCKVNQKAVLKRFWDKVNVRGKNKCWPWTACLLRGYGQFNFLGKTKKPHRIMWELVYGPIPRKLCVLHSCDNRRCVNPKHLFLGTHLDNIQDMVHKNRHRGAVGTANANTTLTEKQIIEIRTLWTTGKYTQTELSTFYPVCQSTIERIVHRKVWRHVGPF